MELSLGNIKAVLTTLLSKLHTLLTPICEGGEPMPCELSAANELVVWVTKGIERLCEEKAERNVHPFGNSHNLWPNVNAWDSFLIGLKGLTLPDINNINHPDDLSERFSANVSDLESNIQALIALVTKIRREAPGAKDRNKAGKRHFLPTDAQRNKYKEPVLNYYSDYVASKDIQHQKKMVHLAVIYQGIAARTGLARKKFYGPDFDDFMYNYCGIKYNDSKTPRGRYRRIDQVRHACVRELQKPNETPTIDPRLGKLFVSQLQEFIRYLPQEETLPHYRAMVPQELE